LRFRLAREDGKGLGTFDGNEVGEETTNVGGSHRSTGNSVGSLVSASPGRKDVESRSENVDTFTVVGKVGSLVSEGRSTDSDGEAGPGRRVVASVLVVATCQLASNY
jgi:hypothetical protein